MDKFPLHVVLGAGLGALVVDVLVKDGHSVRHVRRAAGPTRAGVELLSGDLRDQAFAERATSGASVVYDCAVPAYETWVEELLPLGRVTLNATAKAGAKLVALDNLYMYGRANSPMREDTPHRPCSKKGEVRAELSDLRLNAHAKGELSVVIGRASDFFGPGIRTAAIFGERFFQRVLVGKSAEVLGDPDQPHAYSYGPDVARALVSLGTDPDATGVFHLPTPTAETTRETIATFARALNREIKITRLPDWMLRGVGIFSPLMRAVAEMTYQWKEPFLLDDTKFRKRYQTGPTPVDEAIANTVKWATLNDSPDRNATSRKARA